MLIVCSILFPVLAGIWACRCPLKEGRTRNDYYTGVILVTDLLGILALCFGKSITLFEFAENVTLSFGFDNAGRFFLAAVLILYTAVTFYAYEYMKMEEDPEIFFTFFFVSLGALIAVCSSSNLVTVYLSFEMATLTSVPLVLHERTPAAVAAAQKYLFYSVGGALMGLLGVFFVYYYGTGSREFAMGGFLDPAAAGEHRGSLLAVIFIALIGFGTKAGMYPMHGWLPAAHPIAPAPASALLSGIIAKAGIIAIVRLVYFCVGADFLKGTWVQNIWMILAMLTVFMGSMMAFREKILKKRLAYSTISQISYIMLGLSTLSLDGLEGGLLHLMQHAASKGCLFLAAGAIIYKLGKRDVRSLKGIGKQMPLTMWCFLLASLSLVGIPPMGGFLSKWCLAAAVIRNGQGVFGILPIVILLISALLTAGYLLPVVVDGFFPGKDFDDSGLNPAEPSGWMTVPMACLCVVSLVIGIFGSRIVEVLF